MSCRRGVLVVLYILILMEDVGMLYYCRLKALH